jgi:hypothetical protein
MKKNRLNSSIFCLLFCAFCLLLSSCTVGSITQLALGEEENTGNTDKTNDIKNKELPNTEQANTEQPKSIVSMDLNIEDLLKQIRFAGSAEEEFAKASLESAKKSAGQDWGKTSKFYGESAMFKPSTENLIGYAESSVMTKRILAGKKNSLAAKLRDFQQAVKTYRVAIQLSERTNQPLPVDVRKNVDANITCLEVFIKKPDPKNPICKLVSEALKESQIK